MKKIIILIAVLAQITALSFAGEISPAATTENASRHKAFKVGEKLTYSIDWGFFTIGKATIEVKAIEQVDGKDCYHIVAAAQTTGPGDMLFKVRSSVESWLDVEGLFTRKYVENRSEGKDRSNEQILYDYEKKKAVVKNLDTNQEQLHDIEGPVVDALSLLYAARASPMSFTVDSSATFTCNTGKDNYKIAFKADQKKTMSKKTLGEIAALRFEPQPTLRIVARHGGRAWFWFSDDDRRLPLEASSKMKIGNCKIELVEIETGDPQDKEKKEPITNFNHPKKTSP